MTPDIESTLILHVGKNHAEVPFPVKKELLEKKKKKHIGMAVINVLALASFGYAFSSGMTALPGWVLGLMALVFSANIGMIFWQRSLINKALAFLDEPVNP
jgi:protein-S-isoprenylcysteine O-methyltransferase Ste14